MAASRLLHLSSSFLLLRAYRARSPSLSSCPLLRPRLRSLSFLRPISPIPPSCIQLSFTTSAAAVEAPPETTRVAAVAAAAEAVVAAHPWPEWEQFVEKLKGKGYFEIPTSNSVAVDAEGDSGSSFGSDSGDATKDVNRLKNACLKFARERFDILGSLPKQDIQAVVECGCPNLYRKAVNSAKRLRAFLGLDEGDVCSACNLRGSCDKAYVIAKEDEGARTVDVMRILLYYAVNPASLSVEENPSAKEHVQESVRKLLSELIKLSDTTIDPSLPKPSVNYPVKTEQSQKVIAEVKQSSNVEMKRGDWLCPNCNFLNFARNVRCLECKEDGPKQVNFGRAEMKLGDWTCPTCQFMNFARNKKCFRCQETRPKRELNPGEWECPSCNFLNFRRNQVCKKCNCDRPNDEASRFEDHLWRKPKESSKNDTIKFGDDEDEVDADFDDILPLQEGENKFVVSNRATPAERRLTAARKRDHAS